MTLIRRQPNHITSFGCVMKSWLPPLTPKCPTQLSRYSARRDPLGKSTPPAPQSPLVPRAARPTASSCTTRACRWVRRGCSGDGTHQNGYSEEPSLVMYTTMSGCEFTTRGCSPRDIILTAGAATCRDMMAVTGTSSPALAFFRRMPGSGWEWFVEDCNIKEPHAPGQNMSFCNVIGLDGKFYALSLQRSVVVIGEVGSCFRITGIGANRAVPSKLSRHFREYLVESDGELLLIFSVSRESIDAVEDVEVFQLDVDRLWWVRVGRIGDRTLFLENDCCMWVEASKAGCRKNCVYFTHGGIDEWLVFDMENGNISPAFRSCDEIQQSLSRGF